MTPASPASDQDDAAPTPLSTGEALRGLDDRAFVEVVTEFRERREWDVDEVRERGPQYVDLAVQRDWLVAEQGLLRIERSDSGTRVSGTEVRYFIRTVQGAEVDWSTLVLSREASRSLRR